MSTTSDTSDYEAFRSHWRLMGNAPSTCANYLRCVERLAVPLDQVTHGDLTAYLGDRAETASPSTLQLEVRALRAFFAWRADHHDTLNPAAKLKTVRVAESVVHAITETEHRLMLLQTTSLSFTDRRDRAILAVLWSTGMRRTECARIELDHLDLLAQTLTIPKTTTGKTRTVALDNEATKALQRYLKERQRHQLARSPKLWLGDRSALSSDGIRQMIERRSQAAGCPEVSAHTYRRALAERWLRVGGSESLLRAYAGWSSPQMVARYVRANAQTLAISEHRRLLG